jgi:repressor LexA
MEKLSRRQQEVYDYIKKYCAENGYSPSLADVARGLSLHDSTIAVYVEALKRKGAVTSEYRVARSLRIVDQKPVTDRHSESGA